MPKRALYIGCGRSTCNFNSSGKCTRIVLMHDKNGKCKSFEDPTASWWENFCRGEKRSK